MPLLYVPLLKGKEGEFAAIEALATDVREQVVPLIEVPAIPYDFANERDAKTIDQHLAGLPERLLRSCGALPFYLHLPCFEEELMTEGRCPLAVMMEQCVARGMAPIPVVTTSSSAATLEAVQMGKAQIHRNLCIRLVIDDFEEDFDTDAEVSRILETAGYDTARQVDVILDMGDLGSDYKRALLIARSVLPRVPRLTEWRRVILSGASFPEDLSDVGAATTTKLPRHEWALWNALRRKPSTQQRPDWIFSDYAISHPVFKGLDPRVMQMSASIRYTIEDEWLIVKGRNVRQYGFSQYNELCRILVAKTEYCGADYSWGDFFIAECAEGRLGPGNATTWRKVGVNHHITLVARSVANLNHGI